MIFVRAGLSSWGFLPSWTERNGFLQMFSVVLLCSLLAYLTGPQEPSCVQKESHCLCDHPTSSGDHDQCASSWRAACSGVCCDRKTHTEPRRQKFSHYLQSYRTKPWVLLLVTCISHISPFISWARIWQRLNPCALRNTQDQHIF